MKKILLAILLFSFHYSNAQISSFLKSSEFARIKSTVGKMKYGGTNYIWLEDFGYSEDRSTYNSYRWNDRSETSHKIFLSNDYVVFTYHLALGTNTGTLVYDRNTYQTKTFPYHGVGLNGNSIEIGRSGYFKEGGRWWQKGIINIETNKVTWDPNLER
jgi:hypothetical protein